jgi:hypothetical protein
MMDMKKLFERLLAILDADRKARREDIRSMWFEKSITQEEMEADAEKMEPDSEVMQSVVEHQKVPIQDATVIPVGEPKKKRRRDRNRAAERHRQKLKDFTWENCGPQKRLAVARSGSSRRGRVTRHTKEIDRKMPRRATVARRMRDTFKPNTTRRTEVVWCKDIAIRKGCSRPSVVEEIRNGQTFGRRRRQKLECSKGIKSRDVEEPPHPRIGKKPANSMGGLSGRQQLRLEKKEPKRTYRKTTRLEIAKRTVRPTVERRTRKTGTLWRGRPPPKRKKETPCTGGNGRRSTGLLSKNE